MKAISIFAALLGGVAIGAAAGLLLAPEEGKETRRRLKAQGARIADKVNETLRNKGIKLSREDMEDCLLYTSPSPRDA